MTVIEHESSDQAPPQRSGKVQSGKNFETWSWIFMRLSGLVLLFLALFHFAITHIINDVVETDSGFVNDRWSNPLWRMYDWTLLALGLLHGINGLRYIMDDYIQHPAKRRITKVALYSLTGALFVYGTVTIVSYNAS